jgi:predicted enzyme related to lactoylglutathione lyase
MANNVAFFAVHADNLPRARRFYENVFGWKFEPWGPPDFFLISTGDKSNPGIGGALEKRHDLVPGKSPLCYECSIFVEDVDAVAKAVETYGGKVIMPKCEIPTVGHLIKFQDPEGNVAGAKQGYK